VARADSTIRVNIIGDARGLRTATGRAETQLTGVGNTAKKVGGAIAAAFAVDAVLDFTQTALAEADRLGDATARLEEQLGDLADPLIANAGHFATLGQSAQDMLELEARIADIGTAAGIADDELAPFAQDAAETAAALSLLGDQDAATIIDAIGKAAGGSERPLKELGINLTDAEVEARALADTGKDTADALTDGELSAARMALILEKLEPRVRTVTDAEADLEGRQATLQAKFETLTGKIGDAVDGPLNDLLGWILTGIGGLELLAGAFDDVDSALDDMTGAAGDAVDAIRDLLQLISKVPFVPGGGLIGTLGTGAPNGGGGGGRGAQGSFAPVTVNVQGGSPEVVEQAVRDAIRMAAGRGPLL
jgi:hypothetical protein